MATAGWYGKLPALGDFAQRRLDPAFVAAWDAWLQAAVAESQRQLGGRWLDAYLTAPVWRFLLAPGVVGPQAMAGILLPSVDRVGRYFPLTVCAPLAGLPVAGTAPAQLAAWLAALERAARACLAHDATVEGFESALAQAPATPAASPAGAAAASALMQRSACLELPRAADGTPDFSGLAAGLLDAVLLGYTLWWRADGGPVRLHAHLPPPSAYATMIHSAPAA